MKNLVLGVVVLVAMVALGLWCGASVNETEQAFGGDYENCVEMGHESAMCKRVFEW